MKTEQERFEDVLDMVRILHKGKNGMYGSSFESLLNDEGLIAGFIPIANKFHRIREIKNLLGNDYKGMPSEKDENLVAALEDSALDIGVYGLKLYAWLQLQKNEPTITLDTLKADKITLDTLKADKIVSTTNPNNHWIMKAIKEKDEADEIKYIRNDKNENFSD